MMRTRRASICEGREEEREGEEERERGRGRGEESKLPAMGATSSHSVENRALSEELNNSLPPSSPTLSFNATVMEGERRWRGTGWMGVGAMNCTADETAGTGGGEMEPPESECESARGRRGGEGKVVEVGVPGGT